MSFVVSELTRGGRMAWRRARKASCDACGWCGGKCCSAATAWTALKAPRKSATSIGLWGDVVIESAGSEAGGGAVRCRSRGCLLMEETTRISDREAR